jgi:hypothetical protein
MKPGSRSVQLVSFPAPCVPSFECMRCYLIRHVCAEVSMADIRTLVGYMGRINGRGELVEGERR